MLKLSPPILSFVSPEPDFIKGYKMEARMNQYRQTSPERLPNHRKPNHKVAVVYYLCRNRQLEHPHFMEVTLSSSRGLYLRDVIERLNVLRGRGMASMYSWSCKRSYKNGYVWHDLSDDDLILPAHGNEYVLKGSELFGESNSDRFSPANINIQNLKQLPELVSSRNQQESSSSSSMNELSPLAQRHDSTSMSPESSVGKNSSSNGSMSLIEYKTYKEEEGLADSSMQTKESVTRFKTQETCTKETSTETDSPKAECNENCQDLVSYGKENNEVTGNSVSPPTSCCTKSSSGDTLESLIKADAKKINSFRILEEEEIRLPTNTRLKATNMLMQLISCGSISVKDHSFGIIPNYRAKFSHSKYSSPLFPTSLMFSELDCLSENRRLMGMRLESKEYYSGTLVEKKMVKDEADGASALKRSSSFNADGSIKQLDPVNGFVDSTTGGSKCIPLSIKASIGKESKSASTKSPISDKPGRAMAGHAFNGSKNAFWSQESSSIEEEEKVFKIEERLASGARVIIQSKEPCYSTTFHG